ncbi:MAG: type II toxin-antitoxin system VapB family antitoxin [Deltaproteobacteria bacterium]|nr:type II toxin-antitoxin system VapB family antitoxin [Deltaproteobacteria bacterium]
MHLNIKDSEVHQLAVRLAQKTKKNITQAVKEALVYKLNTLEREQNRKNLTEDLLNIGQRCASYARIDFRSHGDFLYDEHGLPKK